MFRNGVLRASWVLVAAGVWLVGCSCSEENMVRIDITDPANGTSLTLADDTSPGVDGLQITVSAQSVGLDEGAEVDLFLDGTSVSSSTVAVGGDISFTDVTIPGGTHTLFVQTREGGIASGEVVVTSSDMCFGVSFVIPNPTLGEVRLGAGDDTDGEPCGTTFETTVVIATGAPDGATAQLFVNDTPQATATVGAGQARFEGVALGNRDTTPNNLRVTVTDAAGLECGADLAAPVFVACGGPSCSITVPDSMTAFLNADDDVSAEDGFQGNFFVESDTGVTARLIIDGMDSGAPTEMIAGGSAMFGNVSLSEGTHRLTAECIDEGGEAVRSPPAEWTVDTIACDLALGEPTDGQSFIEADDVNAGEAGTQIQMLGTAGSDCSELRVGQCTGIDSAMFGAVTPSWTAEVTLSTTAMQELCVQTRDEAGNTTEARANVRFDTDAPQLEIASPAPDTRFNQASDVVPGDSLCEAAFEVYCDNLGSEVEIMRMDTMALLGAAECVADATVPAPYTGRATLPMLTLPNLEDGSSFPVEARASAGRLVGNSAPISLFSDCAAPELLITRPRCGEMLSPSTQDESMAAGFQYRTVVTSSDASADTTLTIGPAGGAPTYTETDMTVSSTVSFPNADYTVGGSLDVVATATDSAGNVGTSAACSVVVADLPAVMITSPTVDQVLTTAEDCSGDFGMQVQVTGTTDAADGASVSVRIGTSVTSGVVGAGGAISVCASAPEGPSTITVEVTDGRGTGTANLDVIVDTMPPTARIRPVNVSVVDRRGGIVRFTWTAVADTGGGPLSTYELRCADTTITTETDWTGATPFTLTSTPGVRGTMESEDVGGFRPGERLTCSLRGADAAGALTPITDNAVVDIPFMFQTVESAGTVGFGDEIAGVGDVNGDMIPDVLTGGEGGTAYLYYGSAAGLGSTPDVTFRSSASAGFGDEVQAIGDLNADGLNDFAIAAPNADSNAGRVFVFFGRSSGLWPADCDVDIASCAPDLTFDRPPGLSALGVSLAAADFDGDGVMDLVAAAIGVGFFVGEVYVIRGGPTLTSGSSFVLDQASLMAPDGWVIPAPMATSAFGNGVAGVGGSIDGDGRHEILVGAPGFSEAARLVLVRGQAYTAGMGLQLVNGAALETVDTGPQGRFTAVEAAGDWDGDGVLDVHVSSPTGGSAGSVRTYLGTGTGFDPSALQLRNDVPGSGGNNFASTLGSARHPELGNRGDIDGDGLMELFAGSEGHGADPSGGGYLFYGRRPGTDRTRATATPYFAGTDGDRTVGFIGDINGDGFNDLAIGEPEASGGAGRLVIAF